MLMPILLFYSRLSPLVVYTLCSTVISYIMLWLFGGGGECFVTLVIGQPSRWCPLLIGRSYKWSHYEVRTFQNNQRLRVFVLFQLSTGSLRTLVRPLADNVTTVQNNPNQSEVAWICTLSAFHHMATVRRRTNIMAWVSALQLWARHTQECRKNFGISVDFATVYRMGMKQNKTKQNKN